MTPCTTDPILAFSNRNLDLFYRDGYSKQVQTSSMTDPAATQHHWGAAARAAASAAQGPRETRTRNARAARANPPQTG